MRIIIEICLLNNGIKNRQNIETALLISQLHNYTYINEIIIHIIIEVINPTDNIKQLQPCIMWNHFIKFVIFN